MNSNMKKLPDELHINEKSTKELLKALKHEAGFINPASNIRAETQGENSKDTLIDSAKAIRIIYERDVLKTRPSTVCRKYDENPVLERMIFSLYKQKLNLIKINNRRFLNKRRKIDNNVVDMIKEYWHHHSFTYFTLDDLRVYLKSNLGEECVKLNFSSISQKKHWNDL